MSEEVLAQAFVSEIEKFAFDPLEALQAAVAVGAGAWGAMDPKRFDPSWVHPRWKGAGLKGRAASGVLGAATVGGILSLPRLLAAPFRDDDPRLVHMAGVDLASARGGRNAAKSSKIRELFQPRAAAVKRFRENMKP